MSLTNLLLNRPIPRESIELARHRETDLSVSVAVPAAVIAGAAGVPAPIPLESGLDVGGSLSLTSGSSEKVGYTAAGEQVFAVQYRKIHFSWFFCIIKNPPLAP